MLAACCNCLPELGQYAGLEEILPLDTAVTVCQYEEDGDNFDATLRLPLKTKDEVIHWLEEFQAVSKTTMRKSKTFPHAGGKLLYKCIYRCQHNTNQKNPATNSKLSSKNTNCPFQLTVNLRRTDVKRRKNAKDVHFDIPTCIVVRFHHNHDLDSVEVLKKRDVSAEVRAKFEKLFEIGHSPSSALETHKYDLQIEEGADFAAKVNDRRYCPDIQWCFRIYYKMFEAEYGPMSQVELALSMQQRVDQFNGELGDRTVAFLAVEQYMVIAVCTPLMKRVHRLVPESARTVFVDSSSCVDSKNECCVFMLMTNSGEIVGCGLPLGVVITTSKSEQAVSQGFELLKTVLPEGAFYGRGADTGPMAYLTNDCSALRSSLERVFLYSTVLLSQFHVLWDVWRWLWAAKSGVNMRHRSLLYGLVEAAVRAETCDSLADAFTKIYNDPVSESYDRFMSYISQLLDRSTLWASCYRNAADEAKPTTGDAVTLDALAALQKDKIFNRIKSYSPVQLVDFSVSRLERYFERRLKTICRSQDDGRQVRRSCHVFPKDNRVILENVWMISPWEVHVPSQTPVPSVNPAFHVVNMTLFVCTCPVGSTGAPCKHQWAAVTKYPCLLCTDDSGIHPTAIESSARQRMYILATGVEEQLPQSWLVAGDTAEDVMDTIQVDRPTVDDSIDYSDSLMAEAVKAVMKMEAAGEIGKTSSSLIDDDDVTRTIERFVAFSSEMAERISLDPDTYLEPAKSFLSSYESITTNTGLVSALRCFGEYSRAASVVIAGRKRKALAKANRKRMKNGGRTSEKRAAHEDFDKIDSSLHFSI